MARIIGVEAFRLQMESGAKFTLVDVRTPAEYRRAHVAGARLIPLDELDAAQMAAALQRDGHAVYVICEKGGRAAKACEKLMAAGMQEVYSVEGGTVGCERAGVRIERGPGRVISLERQVRIGAGTLVLIGAALAWLASTWFLIVPTIVGCGLVFAGLTDFCGMGLMLAKMPWNSGGRIERSSEATASAG